MTAEILRLLVACLLIGQLALRAWPARAACRAHTESG